MTKDIHEMTYDEIAEFAEEVLTVLRRRAYAEGYEQGTFDAAIAEIVPKETPIETRERLKRTFRESKQAKRDRIVEQAKADVEELTKYTSKTADKPGMPLGWRVVREEFIVNREKRTVVCY